MAQSKTTTRILRFDEQELKDYLAERIKEATVEVMEAVLEAEAQEMVRAAPYERTTLRRDHRNGRRKRKLDTRVGSVELHVPRLRMIPFQSAILERYKRAESSLEEALVEMYLQGVSTRRVNDITEALCGVSVSAGRLSRLNHKVADQLKAWRERPLAASYPYLFLDGTFIHARVGDHVENISLLVAVGVTESGHREVLALESGCVEDQQSWLGLLRRLKQRGLRQVSLVISDAHVGLRQATQQCFPKSKYQRCIFHLMRNVLTKVPPRMRPKISSALKAIFAQENAEEAAAKAKRFIREYSKTLPEAVTVLGMGMDDALTYYEFPAPHWHCIRTNNPLERLMREIKRRLKVVTVFPNVESAMLLATARLKWTQETKWTNRIYLNMSEAITLAA